MIINSPARLNLRSSVQKDHNFTIGQKLSSLIRISYLEGIAVGDDHIGLVGSLDSHSLNQQGIAHDSRVLLRLGKILRIAGHAKLNSVLSGKVPGAVNGTACLIEDF